MKGKDMVYAMQYLDDEKIHQAEYGAFSPGNFYRDEGGRKNPRRIFLLAAVIALASVLVGCGVLYVLHRQQLRIADREIYDMPWVVLSEENEMGTIPQQVLTTSGPEDSKRYQAAKEWNEFEVSYARDHDWDETFLFPAEYEHYEVYSQEMVDKLEEILDKYDLKPIGAQVISQSRKGILDYLGLETVLRPGVPAKINDMDVAYYESGYFTVFCYIQMEEGADRWPYSTYVTCTFSGKEVLDNGVFILDNPDTWEEWNYTTSSGENFLILYSPEYWECYAIYDRGDAMVSLTIQTAQTLYTDNRYSENRMNRQQVEQLLDVMDFTLDPVPGNPALLSGLPEGYDSTQRSQTIDGYTVELKSAVSDGNKAQIVLGITIPDGKPVLVDDGEKYWGLGFEEYSLQCADALYPSNMSTREQDDGDGLDSTLEYVIEWYKEEPEENMEAGAKWTLTLGQMCQETFNNALEQHEYLWKTDTIWKFDFTFDPDSDYRSLEFLSGTTELPAIVGETADGSDDWGTATVRSITLHTNSLHILMDEPLGDVDFSSWREETNPKVVLKDGTPIVLRMDRGNALDQSNTSCQENWKPETAIPLDQVDYLLLIDGTILYPVEL